MESNALVSIIVPVYKVEKYLNKCINTIVHQTYKNLEIILVDDGSPDKSPQLCDMWARKDVRIKVIHKSNGGLSDARNAGLKVATGKYILFVDSDDWISLNMVSDLVEIMEKENADMSICQFARVFSDGRIEANALFSKSPMVLNRKETLNLLIEDTTLTNHVWRKMYRHKLIKNEVFPKGKNFEDIYAMPDLLKCCNKIVCTNKIEYFYRQNEAGIVQNKSLANYRDQITALNYAENKIIDLEPQLKDKVLYYQIIKEISILREISRNKNNNFSPVKEYIRNDILSKPISTYKNIPGKRNKAVYLFLKYSNNISFLYSSISFLKKIYHPIKEKAQIKRDKKDITRKIERDNKPKFYIIGTPEYGNLGDQALMLGEFEFIKKYFPEYTIITIPQRQLYIVDKVKKYITKKDIIGLQAGGNIGTLYPGIHIAQEEAVYKLRDKNLIIFPQTFYYSNSKKGKEWLQKTYKVYKKCSNLIVFVRDNSSFELLHKHMPGINVCLVPDMVLMLTNNKNTYNKDNIRYKRVLVLLRHDNEQTLTWKEKDKIFTALDKNFSDILEADMHVYHDFESIEAAKSSVIEQLQKIRQSELVVTDRLHGMIFSFLTNTPCIVLKSKSPKILGVYQWIRDRKNICLINEISDVDKAIQELKYLHDECDKESNTKIEIQYNKMAKTIKEKVLNGIKNN